MSPRENQSRVWHAAYMNDYNYRFPREGKGSKNKNKDKHDRSAPYAGRGKGYRSRSPYWAADQTGG
eukprot:7512793-Pyramimonas_sp.AAC.1